jgi:hypothetical protein
MPRSSIERLSAVTKEKRAASRKRELLTLLPRQVGMTAGLHEAWKKMPTLNLYSLSVCTLCYEERMTAKKQPPTHNYLKPSYKESSKPKLAQCNGTGFTPL